jgi:diaminohydroxyphosphoribosylaminopyrimidine deaminase/5-amino-6-(5-phosphoribosylamino)uracil reductase
LNTDHLERALALAHANAHITPPNPSVGCVLVRADGVVIGEGAPQATGGAHGEIMALRDAQARGNDVQGASAYVTLEPCAHQGRTGPCSDALVQAGIGRVVATTGDPNPLVSGQGFARLRAAGMAVEVLATDHPLALASRELNIGFFSRMLRGKPWVRMKIAASLDGQTALDNGQSQWITSAPARADGHAWRARVGAVLTGIGTVLEDNPRLDVRLFDTPRQPPLVVVDSRLETPLNAALFIAGRSVLIYAAVEDAVKQAALEQAGATVVVCPGGGQKVDLQAMLADLHQRGIHEVHVEAGHKLNGSLVRESLVDEFLVYLAPKMLGAGRGMLNIGPFTELSHGLELSFASVERIGPDLRVLARVQGRDDFLHS